MEATAAQHFQRFAQARLPITLGPHMQKESANQHIRKASQEGTEHEERHRGSRNSKMQHMLNLLAEAIAGTASAAQRH